MTNVELIRSQVERYKNKMNGKLEEEAKMRVYDVTHRSMFKFCNEILEFIDGLPKNEGKDYWDDSTETTSVVDYCRQRISEILENPKHYGSSRGPALVEAYKNVIAFCRVGAAAQGSDKEKARKKAEELALTLSEPEMNNEPIVELLVDMAKWQMAQDARLVEIAYVDGMDRYKYLSETRMKAEIVTLIDGGLFVPVSREYRVGDRVLVQIIKTDNNGTSTANTKSHLSDRR